ncbi:MAG TPA: NAD+ synthase [Planctomycetota bacterium]|nr:NAD+ synthase [Planctomycetota bacterium]
MKVALAQINPLVGDLEGNRLKVLDALEAAEVDGVDLVVFAELTLIGYPPRDLLDHERFIDANLETFHKVVHEVKETAAVIGYVDRDVSGRRPALLNAAALVHRGNVVSVHYKSLLPTYDVFDELRYFSPAETVTATELAGTKLGISICEDAWNDESFWSRRRYTVDPVAKLSAAGAEVLVNVSASPYSFGKRDLRLRMLSELAKKHGRFLVLVNQVGGNDELVFDGNSAVFAPDGRVIAHAASFAEDFVTVELSQDTPALEVRPEDVGTLHDALVLGLRDYVTKSGFRRAVVGLSGGVDSALTACIAVDALGAGNVRGVSMPSTYSSQHSIDDAKTLAANLGIRFDLVRIDPMVESFTKALAPQFAGTEPDVAEENIQARIRGIVLMALSNKFGELVLATGNKSELSVGYCTLYGDMCGALAVIGDVPKMKVYELARHVNRSRQVIPRNTLTKPPSAELKPDQTDQDTLPPYDVLDGILTAYVEELRDPDAIVRLGFDADIVGRVIRMIRQSEYKRKQAAPVIKVTSKAFGMGRRIPIVQGWR